MTFLRNTAKRRTFVLSSVSDRHSADYVSARAAIQRPRHFEAEFFFSCRQTCCMSACRRHSRPNFFSGVTDSNWLQIAAIDRGVISTSQFKGRNLTGQLEPRLFLTGQLEPRLLLPPPATAAVSRHPDVVLLVMCSSCVVDVVLLR